jgi:ubiquinone biosynthesis protein
VIVKVRRPGVVEQVEEDLEILQNLASAMSRHWEFAAFYDAEGLAQEFAQTLQSELNYLQEARNAESFAWNFAGDPKVHLMFAVGFFFALGIYLASSILRSGRN